MTEVYWLINTKVDIIVPRDQSFMSADSYKTLSSIVNADFQLTDLKWFLLMSKTKYYCPEG